MLQGAWMSSDIIPLTTTIAT